MARGWGIRRYALSVIVLSGILAGCDGAGSSPPASAGPPASPAPSVIASAAGPLASTFGVQPYRLSLERSGQSPTPTRTISRAADCADLPSDWFVQLCTLTLRPHWQDIIGPHDPINVPSGGESMTWWAALGRAVIDQDTSICMDVSMRMWISLGSSLGAPPPAGATQEPIHPVAACIEYFHSSLARGPIQIQGPSYHLSVQTSTSDFVRISAGEPLRMSASSPAPGFDPYIGCFLNALSRQQCTDMINAVTPNLGDRARAVTTLGVSAQLYGCPSPVSPCPAPVGGTWLGSVAASEGDKVVQAFDVALVDRQLQVVEVPYKP